jgi:hypothetical protein
MTISTRVGASSQWLCGFSSNERRMMTEQLRPLVRPLERLGKWAWGFALIAVVLYVVSAGLAHGDQATIQVLANEAAKFLVGAVAVCVLSRVIAGGLRQR